MIGTLRLLPLLVAGAFFMEFLDGTVIATAIPQMAVTFGVRPADLGIGVSAYLVTLAVLLPLSGWVADRYGARLVFTGALAVFTLASLLCAASNDLVSFVAARILQGAGGAMMVPVGRLVVLRTTAKENLVQAIATLTWPALLAPIIAPPLGGFLTTYATWRWVFFINLPVGLLGIAMALKLMPNDTGSRRPLDWIGFVLTALACLCLMIGIEMVGAQQIAWLQAGTLLIGGFALGVIAVVAARRHPTPLLELDTLAVPSFAASILGGSIFRVVISTVPFLLPLLFQVGFGYDAFHSGLLLLPVFIGNLVIKPFTTPILRRFGFRRVLCGNGLLAAATIAGCACITADLPLPLIVTLLFLSGVTRSIQLTAINTLAFADVPPDRMRGANTLFNMVQQISLGLGVAMGVLALRVAQTLREDGTATLVPHDFHAAFLLIGTIAVLAIADAYWLDPNTGLHVSRGKVQNR